ncbi:FAD-binding oxidoreductase [Spirosoma jeollabukense]
MKRLLLTLLAFSLVLSGLCVQAQGIHVTVSNVATVRKTVPVSTPATYQGRQILVGNGGGFTGFTTTYYLLENGKLFGRRSRDTTFTLIRRQTSTTTKRMFSQIENACKIKKTKFSNPGNTYKFVRWRKGKLEYTVTWGEAGKTVPASYPKFYDSFMAMIPTASRLK